jgi:hypothetical protein
MANPSPAAVIGMHPLAGWAAAGSLLGGYGPGATSGRVGGAAATAAKVWAVGVPLGLALRGLSRGYVPPTPFIAISMGVTAVLMIGWRTAFAALSPKVWRSVRACMCVMGEAVKQFSTYFVYAFACAGCSGGGGTRALTASVYVRLIALAAAPPSTPLHLNQEPELSSRAKAARRGDRSGGPWEFVQLLLSLTKRW